MESTAPFRLTDILRKHGVPFVIIGGHAVTYHGYVRTTEDVDIIFERTSESEESLLRALQELNARWIGDEIDPVSGLERVYEITAAFVRSTHLMMLETDVGFVDIFDFIPGYEDVPIHEVFRSSTPSPMGPVVSLSWLRRMKAVSGRMKDHFDLENLPEADPE
jgi:hypothetical protein